MPRTIRFHLDEDTDPAIAAGLRRHGIDVTTSQETGLLGAVDTIQLSHAHAQGRVLFTHDGDHLTLNVTLGALSTPGVSSASVSRSWNATTSWRVTVPTARRSLS